MNAILASSSASVPTWATILIVVLVLTVLGLFLLLRKERAKAPKNSRGAIFFVRRAKPGLDSWVGAGLVVYEVVAIVCCLWLANRTWPGNASNVRRFEQCHRLALVGDVTDDSLMKLRQAQAAISRWELEGYPSVTGLDRLTISNGLLLTSEIISAGATPPPDKSAAAKGITNLTARVDVLLTTDSNNNLTVNGEIVMVSNASSSGTSETNAKKDVQPASKGKSEKAGAPDRITGNSVPTLEAFFGADSNNAAPLRVYASTNSGQNLVIPEFTYALTNGTTLAFSLLCPPDFITNFVLWEPMPDAVTIAVRSVNSSTNKFFWLPWSGDLKIVTASQLDTNLALVNSAISELLARQNAIAATGTNSSEIARFNPPLTASEILDYRSRLIQEASQEGVYHFGSKVADLIVLLMAVGAIGAGVRAVASIGQYIGECRFKRRWWSFYFLRPVEGAVIAVGFYLVIAGGLWSLTFTSNASSASMVQSANTTNAVALAANSALLSPPVTLVATVASLNQSQIPSTLSFCALAFMIGMFSDEATKKLAKIASALLTDNTGTDNLESTAPSLTAGSAVPLFSLESIENLQAFVNQLKGTGPNTAVTKFLLAQPSFDDFSAVIDALNVEQIQNTDAKLKNVLVDALNAAIQAGPIFDEKRFSGITLSHATQTLRLANPSGLGQVLLNHQLVMDAYSPPNTPEVCITNTTTRWLVEIDGTGFKPGAAVVVNNNKLPASSNIAVINNNDTVRFVYQQTAPDPTQTLDVIVTNPGDAGDRAVASTKLTFTLAATTAGSNS